MKGEMMQTVNIQELILGGANIDVALFVVCPRCMGVGTYEQKFLGGPYGIDQIHQENCGKCYKENGKATGKMMVRTSLRDLVGIIKESRG